ncbi:hypothetical protein [Nesterenkonia rhizosphaerae]|uniref:DUF222 domain-containing protein n=1 Tax=Nesterenkonia rhizosphaerae TaxID=1348272 RepID=A0ABP9G6W2_9MICC
MTTLPGNPHAASAKQELNLADPELSEGLPEEESAERDMAAKLAQAHATLALAYEQRTANLIAAVDLLHTYEMTAEPKRTKAMPNMEQEIQGQLRARLGLTEGDATPRIPRQVDTIAGLTPGSVVRDRDGVVREVHAGHLHLRLTGVSSDGLPKFLAPFTVLYDAPEGDTHGNA